MAAVATVAVVAAAADVPQVEILAEVVHLMIMMMGHEGLGRCQLPNHSA
jgi:hypothetical protein